MRADFMYDCAPYFVCFAYKFTGKERDTESNLDYFGARYYSSTMGRWTNPDPWLGSMNLANPQSLNRYAYVANNPLTFTDPLGLELMSPGDNPGGIGGPDQQTICPPTGPCQFTAYLTLPWGPSTPPPPPDNPGGGGYGNSGLGPGGGGLSWRGSFGNPIANALFSPQVGGRYFGGAYNVVNQAAIGTTVVYGGLLAAMVTPEIAGAAADRVAFGEGAGRLFWSGGGLGGPAESAAIASGLGRVITQTFAGRALMGAEAALGLGYAQTQPAWNFLSEKFASGAAGVVNAFLYNPNPAGIYMSTELGTLLANPSVSVLIERIVDQP
jgi:RHS repeat-associated protein